MIQKEKEYFERQIFSLQILRLSPIKGKQLEKLVKQFAKTIQVENEVEFGINMNQYELAYQQERDSESQFKNIFIRRKLEVENKKIAYKINNNDDDNAIKIYAIKIFAMKQSKAKELEKIIKQFAKDLLITNIQLQSQNQYELVSILSFDFQYKASLYFERRKLNELFIIPKQDALLYKHLQQINRNKKNQLMDQSCEDDLYDQNQNDDNESNNKIQAPSVLKKVKYDTLSPQDEVFCSSPLMQSPAKEEMQNGSPSEDNQTNQQLHKKLNDKIAEYSNPYKEQMQNFDLKVIPGQLSVKLSALLGMPSEKHPPPYFKKMVINGLPSYWKTQHRKMLGINDFNFPKDYPIEEWKKAGMVIKKQEFNLEEQSYQESQIYEDESTVRDRVNRIIRKAQPQIAFKIDLSHQNQNQEKDEKDQQFIKFLQS